MKKIELIVAHSIKKKGAVNEELGLNEYNLSEELVMAIIDELIIERNMDDKIIINIVYRDNGYKNMIENLNADLIMSFHFNAYNKKASGTEMLIADGVYDKEEINIVAELSKNISDAIGIKNRGVKEVMRGARGSALLHDADASLTVLCETCFIDNNLDMEKYEHSFNAVVNAYVNWIMEYCK